MQAWLSSSFTRYYPASRAETCETLSLDLARGERGSFQVVFRREFTENYLDVTASAIAPDGINVQIRRIGYVPMPHHNTNTPLDEMDGREFVPGLVPDPLFPVSMIRAGADETNSFWITVWTSTEMAPGTYPVSITLTAEGEEEITLTSNVVVHRAVLPTRRDFYLTHWFYADAICAWYKTELWEDRFWEIVEPYFRDVAIHQQDIVYIPVFTPPLDGIKRPTQLLNVRRNGDRYEFDWTLVRKWVKLAQACGIERFEWTHFFTQWGVKHALRIYEGHGETATLLWPPETGATSQVYRDFLAQFLPELYDFLQAEGILEYSHFHLSDEPHGDMIEDYRAARELLRELAPWIKVMDALSDITFARTGLTDFPLPSTETAADFVKEGFTAGVYYCCGPRGKYVNRMLDTPLAKIRMTGWLFYRMQACGFLNWGYNYWFKSQSTELIDPYTTSDAKVWPGWPYGDPFIVYPGKDGPVDSIRWEAFAQGMQDYALLQAAGIEPNDESLADIKGYDDFPKRAEWILQHRAEILAKLDAE
jgi:hypothetical protein